MLVSPNFSLLFIHIQKTSGISLKKLIKNNDPKAYEYKNTHAPLTIKDYKKFKNYFKFTIVRNPIKLCASCYYFECFNPRKKFNDRRGMDFKSWLRWKSSCSLPDHNIFPKQLPFFTDQDGNILVDKIIRYENINEEVDKLCKKFNWKNNFRNIRIHGNNNYDWKEPYKDPNNIKLVEEICKEDIEYFNYKFPEK